MTARPSSSQSTPPTSRPGRSGASSPRASGRWVGCGCGRARSMTDRARSSYVATYRHVDGAWIVQFADPDIATFGRTLAAAKQHARSALAVFLEVDDLQRAGVEVV